MLDQSDADWLIAMGKRFSSPRIVSIPPGVDDTYHLVGEDERERFLLDVWRGTLRLSKLKFQTRGRHVVVLVRLDIDGAPHTNPDGTKIGGSHIHLYREGYEDRWAFEVPQNKFNDPANIPQTFEDFCAYCNIGELPSFQTEFL